MVGASGGDVEKPNKVIGARRPAVHELEKRCGLDRVFEKGVAVGDAVDRFDFNQGRALAGRADEVASAAEVQGRILEDEVMTGAGGDKVVAVEQVEGGAKVGRSLSRCGAALHRGREIRVVFGTINLVVTPAVSRQAMVHHRVGGG